MNALKIILTINSCLMVSGTSVRGAQVRSNTRSNTRRNLYDIPGECTVPKFEEAVGGRAALADLLGVSDVNDGSAIENELQSRCESALEPAIDLVDTLGKGPQFLKNFIDGGTTWNDNYADLEGGGLYELTTDGAVIMSADTSGTVFGTPDGGTSVYYDRYFSNFYAGEEECQLGVIECCYTSSRKSATGRMGLEDNAEMCAMDLTAAKKSNHIKARSFTYFDTQAADDTYCSGFAYEKDSFDEKVKYNTFFHMAMTTNLYNNGFVKNIPGAPLCGCLEQMPIIDNAACVKAIEGYKMDADGNVSIDVSWEDCGKDLASYYDTLEGKSKLEKYLVKEKIVGEDNCAAASLSFMNDQMLVPKVITEVQYYITVSNLLDNCPDSMDVMEEDCGAAGSDVGGTLRNGEVVKGSWNHVSYGCSLQRESGDIHYNTNTNAANTDHFTPVCINAGH